jgi:hypothetical protein
VAVGTVFAVGVSRIPKITKLTKKKDREFE